MKESTFYNFIRLMRYFDLKLTYLFVIIKILFNSLSEYYSINFSSFDNGNVFVFDFIMD